MKIYRLISSLAMAALSIPSQATIDKICKDAAAAMANRMHADRESKKLIPKICAVCDELVTVGNPCRLIEINKFREFCQKGKAEKSLVTFYYNQTVVDQYTAKDERLKEYVLSPATLVTKNAVNRDSVLLCSACANTFEANKPKSKTYNTPPKSIWHGLLVGDPPECLTMLRPPELAIVSANRVITHAITMYANHHDGIHGWHSMFENKADKNVKDVNGLLNLGFKGEIVCVLCGPFTTTQDALTRTQMTIRPEKVIEAFKWLFENNYYYKNNDKFVMPNENDIPQVVILDGDDL